MGNCQATADAEAIVIYHPGFGSNGSYKIYWWSSVTAEEIMVLYPGYYVSLMGTVSTEEGIRLKQIKILRPQDTLSIGRVYRLISFEDVLLELSARTRGKLVVRGGEEEEDGGSRHRKKGPSHRTKSRTINCCSYEVVKGMVQIDGSNTTTTSSRSRSSSSSSTTTSSSSRMHCRQWRPSLESISEFGV